MNTYSDEYAVKVLWFIGVAVCEGLTQDLCKALHARDAENVNVEVATERLNEREVDLQCNIIFVLFVRGKYAQNHVVWIPVNVKYYISKVIRQQRKRELIMTLECQNIMFK